jgi:hypothetical protein
MVDYTLFNRGYYPFNVSPGCAMVDAFESIHPHHTPFSRIEPPFFSNILFDNTAYKRRARHCSVRFNF